MNDETKADPAAENYALGLVEAGEQLMQRTQAYMERVRERRVFRASEHRVMGAPTLARLTALREGLEAARGEISMLLAETAEPNDPVELARIHADVLASLGEEVQ